jgi:hypothetical protein
MNYRQFCDISHEQKKQSYPVYTHHTTMISLLTNFRDQIQQRNHQLRKSYWK